MNTMFPGKGLRLARASSNAQEPVWASMRTPEYTILDAGHTVGVALNAGLNTDLNVEYAVAPAGTAFSIMYDISPDFSTEYALDTVAAVGAQTTYTWSVANGVNLSGFIRLANSGGQTISAAYVQQMASY